jgi:hypothetical protein
VQGALGALAPEPYHVGFFQTKNFNRSHGTPKETKVKTALAPDYKRRVEI